MEKNLLDFSKDYILENESIKLIPLSEIHINYLIGISSEKEIWTYFLDKGLGKEKIVNYCLSAIRRRRQKEEYPFVIFDKRVNKYAGMTRMYNYDNQIGVIKIGHTWLGKEFWGTQLNKHCKFLMFDFIFENINAERIGFGVHAQNARSINALLSIGCEQEGVLRNFLPSFDNDNRIDLLLFSIIKQDWHTKVKAMLQEKLI